MPRHYDKNGVLYKYETARTKCNICDITFLLRNKKKHINSEKHIKNKKISELFKQLISKNI